MTQPSPAFMSVRADLWNTASNLPLAQRLGKDFVLCGDVNAHHTAWGSQSLLSTRPATVGRHQSIRPVNPKHRLSHFHTACGSGCLVCHRRQPGHTGLSLHMDTTPGHLGMRRPAHSA
ncbi:hypothetical protein MTO96_032653 [Rhipicephalus appendiculatus]